MKTKCFRLFLTLVLIAAVTLPAAAARVTLSLSAGYGGGSIHKGDTFYIIYKVSDTDAVPSAPSHVPGANVLYFTKTGQSSSYSSDGHTSHSSYSAEYTLTVRATQEGKFSFGPVSVGGARSNSVSYTIGGATASSTAAANHQPSPDATAASSSSSSNPKFVGTGNGNLFLRASVSKSNAYENEALVYTVKLYCSFSAIRFVGATSAPKFEGFVVEESQNTDKQLHYETYNGKTYATAVIARYIIFPQMKGQLKVIGNTYTVAVDERLYYNDPLFGSLSTSSPVQLNVKPNDLTVNVKALPQPQPADFSGGVGNFRLTASLPPQKFLTNQAASVVYTVEGSGNLKYVKLPELNTLYPSELEVYSPETDIKTAVGTDNVSGSIKFDYSFMPLEEGSFKIPDVTLVYFNPSTGQYEKSVARGFTIQVGKGTASDKSQTKLGKRFDERLLPVEGNLSHRHEPYVDGFAYWLWYIVPTVLLVLAIVFYRKHISNMNDVIGMRSRRAGKMARRRLRKAEQCMKGGKTEQFYEEVTKAVWGYLGDKLKMRTSDLNRENITDKLTNAFITLPVITEVINVLDECELARFTPGDEKQNMARVYDRAVKVIEDIDASIVTNVRKLENEADGFPTLSETSEAEDDSRYVNDQKTPLSQPLGDGGMPDHIDGKKGGEA